MHARWESAHHGCCATVPSLLAMVWIGWCPVLRCCSSAPLPCCLQVSRYFGDNVHIMLSALGDSCDMDHEHRTTAMVSAVFILLQYPFATVEILTNSVYYFEYDFAGVMDLLFRRGMERRLTISQVAPEYRRLCSVAVFLQPPKAKQRRRTALIVPAGSLPLEADLLTSLLKVSALCHAAQRCISARSSLDTAPFYLLQLLSLLQRLRSGKSVLSPTYL